jgi:hypothetical protein
LRIVAVNEIKLAFPGYAMKNGVIVLKFHGVPAHVRDLEGAPVCGNFFREPPHLAPKYSEAGGLVFMAEVEEHLKSDANTQYGDARAEEFLKQAVQSKLLQVFHGFPGCSDPRKYYPVRTSYFIMGVGDSAPKSQVIQGSVHAGQVPCFIVEYCNHAAALLFKMN